MSSGLLLRWLLYKEGTVLDWAAGHRAVDALTEEEAEMVADCINSESTKDARQVLHEALRYLADGENQDVSTIGVPGYRLLISGGMSWGDNPSNGFGYISDLGWAPTVLKAVGFLTEEE